MARPRVVITGISGVTPLGLDMATTWKRLVAGESGSGPISLFDVTDYKCKIAGEVRDFDGTKYLSKKEIRHMDRFTQFAVAGADMLFEDSGFKVTPENCDDTGCILGVGIGGLRTIELNCKKLIEQGPNKISPFLIPSFIANMAPGHIAIKYGLRGPNVVTTTACASATTAIGTAYSEMLLGRIRACVTGGVEAAVTPVGISGFCALKALCTDHNDDPTHASRPFDAERNGFVSGEGCGFLMLERLEDAQARGAKIYAEVVGYGNTDDAYHITRPDPAAAGIARAISLAVTEGDVKPSEGLYINAHGTSTKLNDSSETAGIKHALGEDAARAAHVSSTKSMTGHMIGATGAIEVMACAMALEQGVVPPTINYHTPDPACDLDYTPNRAVRADLTWALSTNLGFGGHNAAIALRRYARS